MYPGRDGEDQVSAIELTAGKQIQGGCQHSSPARQRNRMKVIVIERRAAVMQQKMSKVEDQREAELQIRVREAHDGTRHREPGKHGGYGDHESCDRSGDADIEERGARADEAAYADEGAEGSNQSGRGNKERKSCADTVVTAEKVVSQFVREQNSHDCQREWNSEQKQPGTLPDPLHGEQGQQFVAGCEGFHVVIEVVLQARANQDRGAEGEQEQ